MEKIYIRILIYKDLGDEEFISSFLQDWFFNFSHISPERYSHGEPINKKIDVENLDEIEREWKTPSDLMTTLSICNLPSFKGITPHE